MKLHVLMIIELGLPVVFRAKQPQLRRPRRKGLFSQAKEEFDRVFRERLGRLSRVCKL